MGAVGLLEKARAAGLRVSVQGDKLIVTGPKRAAPLVQSLAEHKAEIMALLTTGALPPDEDADYEPPTWSRRYELKKAGVPNWRTPAPLPWLDNPERN